MSEGRIRLSEIAERAGVSISTVSRVINDKGPINPATRRRVMTAVDVLGYDRPARLRPRPVGLVGVLVPELDNPFFPRLAEQIEAALGREGYTPLLGSHSLGGVHEDSYIETLLDHAVSGIVFVSGIHAVAETDPGRYRRLTEAGLPVVLVNGHLDDTGAASLSVDDTAMVDLAVTHLANMGHARIGLALGQQRYTVCRRRTEAFEAAAVRLLDESLTPAALDRLVSYTTWTVEGGEEAGGLLLDAGVTGIVCGSDIMALGVVRAVRARGLRVPEDVSVVGADDSLMVQFTDPPLTTVRQPATAMAQALTLTLIEMIGGAPAPPAEVLLAPELVVRGSTARAPDQRPPAM